MNQKISNFDQIASLRRYTLTEGRGKGLDVIDCDNGKIRFLLNVSKALDIMQLYHGGQNVSFLSKNAFEAKDLPFLRRFEGGMLYTCGLDSAGRREGHELHGSLHNTVAQVIHASCDEKGIEVEAIIRDTELFGKNLVLRRRIFTEIGSEQLTLEDRLTNEGYTDAEYCLLYHINAGYPMLDEGANVVADIAEVHTRSEWAKQRMATMTEIGAAVPGEDETCYYLTLNKPEIALVNKRMGKAFTVSYSNDTLPRFLMWKSMASGDYALGLEPCTTELDTSFTYKPIKPGEEIRFRLGLKISGVNE